MFYKNENVLVQKKKKETKSKEEKKVVDSMAAAVNLYKNQYLKLRQQDSEGKKGRGNGEMGLPKGAGGGKAAERADKDENRDGVCKRGRIR